MEKLHNYGLQRIKIKHNIVDACEMIYHFPIFAFAGSRSEKRKREDRYIVVRDASTSHRLNVEAGERAKATDIQV